MRNKSLVATVCLLSALVCTTALAHVSISSGPAAANARAEIVFGVGHGCDGADTYTVTVDIPAGFTSVRPMTSDFGRASVTKDSAGNVTSVTWQKADADLMSADDLFYKLSLRVRTPNTPFKTVYFPVHQTCRTSEGVTSTVDWAATPGTEGEPAAELVLVPARIPGWNKFTLAEAIEDFTPYFNDALIVWRGSQAYSTNLHTTELIANTEGVSALSGALNAGDVIWVKY